MHAMQQMRVAYSRQRVHWSSAEMHFSSAVISRTRDVHTGVELKAYLFSPLKGAHTIIIRHKHFSII